MTRRLCAVLVLTAVLTPARSAETPEKMMQKAKDVLAPLDGAITLPGLKEPVEILRDRWGIAHIYAKNDDDLFFAQGFVVAQDRLFQLDLWRRIGRGETAELVGKKGIEADRFARLIKYRGDLDAEWASYAPDARRIATAFTRGINACIDQLGERLPIEFQVLGQRPGKWQPEDVLLRMSGIYMSRNFQAEVLRAELVAAVGVDKARRLAPTDPVRAFAPAPGLELAGIERTILTGYEEATKPLPFEAPHSGSNNWVVDGTLSASGKPLLAGDPHRSITLPSLRYLVHLNAPGWNVIGAGEPALPGVALGHNDRVAWAFTIVNTDQADLYVEDTKPNDPTQYRVGDRWESMKVIKEKLTVKGEKEPIELELRFTRHGPVLHQDPKRNRAFALRWTGSEPGSAAYLASLSLDRVKNAREFVEALRRWKLPALNMIHADVDGAIGWVAAGLTPVRKGWDGLLPVPGAKGDYEWQGFLRREDYPQLANPAAHYIATANQNILPEGYKHEIGYEWSAPYRYRQIKKRLEAKPKFDLDDFKSIQHDNTTIPGQTLARLLKNASVTDPALKPYAEMIISWDGVLTRESKAGPLYAVWLNELVEGLFKPHVPARLLEFVRGRSGIPTLLAALEKPDAAWFGDEPEKKRDELLRSTLAMAVPKVKKRLGDDPEKWAWGKMHTAPFRHPLAGLGPEYDKAFSLGPVPRPGDGLTPNATSIDLATYQQIAGASYRHVLDLADWDRGLATSTPGQSGQPGSPHYADLLPLWAEGEYFPLAFSRTKVEEVMKHRLHLKPKE
jgi:penicillin amidase